MHKNALRLTSLAACVSAAHPSRGTPTKDLGERYLKTLQEVMQVQPGDADRAIEYIRSRSLVRTYAIRGEANVEAIHRAATAGQLEMQLQDWLLSDPSLPSSAGRERDAVATGTVELCAELGHLRVPPGTQQTSGRLLTLVAERAGVLPIRSGERNPFLPPPAFLAVAYFHVLRSDLPFVRAILDQFRLGTPLGFASDLSRASEQIVAAVELATSRTAANRTLFQWLDKQKAAARRLVEALDHGARAGGGASLQSKYRPIEDLLLPRLEFMVDMRILTKPSPSEFTYELSSQGAEFRDRLDRPDWTPDRRYFESIGALFGFGAVQVAPEHMASHLAAAYELLRNVAGYAPIEESVLLANALAWLSGHPALPEMDQVKDALAELARTERTVRIVSDRHRRPGAFKIVSAA